MSPPPPLPPWLRACIDICDGLHRIESLKALVITRRQDLDEFHSKWYRKALILTEKINITKTMPRVVGSQIHRSKTPAERVSHYYKRTTAVPLLDHLMCELDYRFDSSKTEANFNGFVIVPAKLKAIVQQPEKVHWKETFSLFANLLGMIYQMDYHYIVNLTYGIHTTLVIRDLFQIMYQVL